MGGERQPGKGRSSWLSLPVRLPTSSKHPSKRVLFASFLSKFINSHLIKIVAIRKVYMYVYLLLLIDTQGPLPSAPHHRNPHAYLRCQNLEIRNQGTFIIAPNPAAD